MPENTNKTTIVSPENLEAALTDVYGYIKDKIAEGKHLSMKVVDTLPVTGEEDIIYLVPSGISLDNNTKDEYIYVNDSWELIGSTAIDLSDYVQKSDLQPLTTTELDAMIARAKGEST